MGRPVIYLDASVLVPLFLPEPRSNDAAALLRNNEAAISDLGVAEFSSAISLGVRVGRFPVEFAQKTLRVFDEWVAIHELAEEALGEDFSEATKYIRRVDLKLRTPDALHIAIAKRLGATLATFDARLAAAAKGVGLTVVE